jgi:poly(3-hydroxybutyrate) depolymerase
MSKRLLVSLVLLLTAGASSAAVSPGLNVRDLPFAGLARSYRLRVPVSYDGSTAVPLVVDIHGLLSSSAQQAGISRWAPIAERENLIVAYPEGLNSAWNAGICCGNRGIDDLGFIRAVVADVAASANIDPARIYATGLSNGGAMTQRLACDASDLFAAFAPMAFPLPFRPLSGCQPDRAVPVLTFMGLTDVLVRYTDGIFPSAPDTFAYWRDLDGCEGSEPDQRVEQGLSRCETFTRCTNGVQAGLCSITARSFGGTGIDGHVLYLNDDFELAEVAWAFFTQFRLPDPAPAAPTPVELAGTARIKKIGERPTKAPLTWTLTLGDGTWAGVQSQAVFTGSARRGRRNHRMVELGLTPPAREALVAAVSAQVGEPVTLDAAKLVARVSRRRGVLRLVGHLKLTGATSGVVRYSFVLKPT